MRWPRSLAGAAAALPIALACLACDAARDRRAEWVPEPWPRPSARVDLLEQEARVRGEAMPSGAGVLAEWSGAGLLGDWEWAESASGRALSLRRMPSSVERARWLRVALRPGRARRVGLLPIMAGVDTSAPAFRHQVAVIPENAPAERRVTLTFSLRESIWGNWFDAMETPRPVELTITVEGDQPTGATIEEIALLGDDAELSGAAAAVAPVEIEGTVRPAWMVAAGAAVEIEADVPPGTSVLRWYDGAAGGAGPRVVSVREGDTSTELWRSSAGASWTPTERSLSRWAGRRVVIELAALPRRDETGPEQEPSSRGTGFFATPVITSLAPGPRPPDVLVYMIDTLRADRIGAWGSSSARTPNLDRLATEGASFRGAISSSCWTKPAVATLMTGVHPTTHGVGATSSLDLLPAGVPLLQERFGAAGWRTGSFTANPFGSNLSRLERGFDVARLPRAWAGSIGALGHATAHQLHGALLAWVSEAPDRPFFAYVHTLEVHEHGAPWNAGGLPGVPAYDRAVSRADALLGDLLEALDAAGRLDDLLVVVVSDHGESIGEHGFVGHGQSLHQTEVHVPLIFWSPGRIPARRYNAPVALADVAPTLLDVAGLETLDAAQGASLLPVNAGQGAHRPVVATHQPIGTFPDTPGQYALVTGSGGKLLRVDGIGEVAFDLAADEAERTPLGEVSTALRRELDDWIARQRQARQRFQRTYGQDEVDRSEADPRDLETLRSLGYAD